MSEHRVSQSGVGPSGPGATVLPIERARLYGAEPGQGYAQPDLDDGDWLEVAIPGDVRDALRAAGRIEDPRRDATDTATTWVDEQEWWYRFPLPAVGDLGPDEEVVLRLEGIDTFATVYIDGVARHESINMFRIVEIDVTDQLRGDGPHVAAVQIKRPADLVAGLGDLADRRTGSRVHLRKAQFGYGWDFAPNVPSIGLWRPVSLVRRSRTHIDSVRFQTIRLDGDSAVVSVDVFVTSAASAASGDNARPDGSKTAESAGGPEARITLRAPDGSEVLHTTAEVRDGVARAIGVVDRPELWWPAGQGAAALHTLDVELADDGRVTDTHHSTVGIRTIELDESPNPDELGRRFFRFIVNGRPLPIRGANWVPCEMAVGTITPARYESLLRTAVEANMNMVRIWGGGVYEQDAFYDLCDRLGLLVWQEFMFACAVYPDQDQEWLDNIRAEATDQVRRLRSHPCIALWCGNNEVEVIQSYMGAAKDRSSGANIFYDVLPEVVAQEDGVLGYVPSSPMMGDDTSQGDRHNWNVWHAVASIPAFLADPELEPIRNAIATGGRLDPDSPAGRFCARAMSAHQYLDDPGPFPSEFGLNSYPAKETLAAWVDDPHLTLDDDQIALRIRDRSIANKLELVVSIVGGPITDLDDLIDLSQLTQAEGMKLGLEHYRRRWPHCSGSLLWQLNDCWPGASWSLVDYSGRGKGALDYVRRAYQPVLASFMSDAGGGVSLWVSNDTDTVVRDTVRVRMSKTDGTELWSDEVSVEVGGHSSVPVAAWSADRVESGPDRVLRVASTSAAGPVPANRHLFVPPVELVRPSGKVETRCGRTTDGRLTVDLFADGYALFTHVIVSDPTVRFDDNHFDLEPGERRTLTSLRPTDAGEADLTVSWL